jgi:hypothetical protein
MKLSPREHWLQKVGLFWSKPFECLKAFRDHKFCGVYAWTSMVTGKMYLGSTVDFKQRIYSHVRAVRKSPKQQVHRFLRGFGCHLFFPVPLLECPVLTLRQIERAVINHMQPDLNREWVCVPGSTRKAVRVSKQQRRLKQQRSRPAAAVKPGLCTATFMPGGLCMPSISAALHYAKQHKLRAFSLHVSAGTIHLPATHGTCSMFDQSLVSVEGVEKLQNVPLCECARVLKRPVGQPLVLHMHRLSTVGWQWWASQQLLDVIRMPCTVRSWYKLDQKSFVRLWRVASTWRDAAQRVKLLQLVSKVCRTVHHINLRLSVVIRVPYGLQHMHKQLVHAAETVVKGAGHVDLAVRKLWCDSIRVVQTQGESIGRVFSNFRMFCRSLDCTPTGESLTPYVASNGLQLPTVNGYVSFRGDDPRLPPHIRAITSLHSKFIPVQTGHGGVLSQLAKQFVGVYKQMGVPNVDPKVLLPWLRKLRKQQLSHLSDQTRPTAVTMQRVMTVADLLFKPVSGCLVVTVIDKNNGILYFEDAVAYRSRLMSTYVQDWKHYCTVYRSEQQLLCESICEYQNRKWSKMCNVRNRCGFGYAQCLPKDKDCTLNRPIIPNVNHPLARLFNMAARGFAFVLMNLRLNHYNLFTTQSFVTQLAACEATLQQLYRSGEVVAAQISQSDVKDMYTEITHAEIERCVWYAVECWLSQRRSPVLSVNKHGRRGVVTGYSKDVKTASSMRVTTIASILLYELKHAYFHVGKHTIMRQIMGVAMGSKGGPVLAWCVCMINEHRFHASLGRDSKYIRIFRYFDDVWQLLMIPSSADPQEWVTRQVAALQSECYPASLRLIQNSLDTEAEMLSCYTSVADGHLVCVHRSKNAKYLQQGQPPRFANFVPYASSHAKHTTVMKTCGLGLMHRMFMDTLPENVPLLLPTLMSYQTELSLAGYPATFLVRVFRSFLQHHKVAGCLKWHQLYANFYAAVQSNAC